MIVGWCLTVSMWIGMVHRIGFWSCSSIEVELFLACLVLVWIPRPWEGGVLGLAWYSTLKQPYFQPWQGCFRFLITFSDILSAFLFIAWETKVIFYFLPRYDNLLRPPRGIRMDSRTAGATKKRSPSLRPSIRRQRPPGVVFLGKLTRKDVEQQCSP